MLVGFSPASTSGTTGHYYEGKVGQRLWSRLRRAGLLADAPKEPEDDAFVAAGNGLTNLSGQSAATADELSAAERSSGQADLAMKIDLWRPRLLLFASAPLAEAVLGRPVASGACGHFQGVPAFLLSPPYAARAVSEENERALALALSASVPSQSAGGLDPERAENLRFAIDQNWVHARHSQELREKLTGLYWLVWGAALYYLGTDQRDHFQSAVLFIAIAVASMLAFASTLKWSAEFANHVAAVAVASRALGLNAAPRRHRSRRAGHTVRGPSRLERAMGIGGYLPYRPFTGVMALPLPAPIFLNVGPLFAAITMFGLSLSVGLAVANTLPVIHDACGAVVPDDGFARNAMVALALVVTTGAITFPVLATLRPRWVRRAAFGLGLAGALVLLFSAQALAPMLCSLAPEPNGYVTLAVLAAMAALLASVGVSTVVMRHTMLVIRQRRGWPV